MNKIFGIGLPRSGTTSISVAMLMLGFRTCHSCFSDHVYDVADAFFDTPIWADYQKMDARYPGSKFILTWRDPDAWYDSFNDSLMTYLRDLRQITDLEQIPELQKNDYRCYLSIFGRLPETSRNYMIGRYQQHRQQAEEYFKTRKDDLLVIDLDLHNDPWQVLCPFLGVERPDKPYPHRNAVIKGDWADIRHILKITHHRELPPIMMELIRTNLANGMDPRMIFELLLQKNVPLHLIRDAMGERCPPVEAKFY